MIENAEIRRLEAVRGLGLLDAPPEERFDRIVRLARRLFDVPAALVSLVEEDRQDYLRVGDRNTWRLVRRRSDGA
jgi:hypothetical protein